MTITATPSSPAPTSRRRTSRAAATLTAALLGLALVPAAATAGTSASATPPPAPAGSGPATPVALGTATPVEPGAAAALAQQRGISVAEAARRLGEQQALGERGARVEAGLRGRSGGSYLDADGRLVVTTLDAAGDREAAGAGARAQRVDDSAERLAGIARRLDRAAQAGAGGVQGWYVDVPSNSVVVTVTAGAADTRTRALTALARRFGASVRVEQAPAGTAPRPAEYMVGGYQYVIANGGTCSVGFNTRDGAGRNVVLTAGHCVKQAGTMSRNGYAIGTTRTADYPGNDYGTFWNAYPSYWQPTTSVSKYNGTFVTVRGQWDAPPVGATVCKSGRTTGYTCGTITALNQTVVYTGGYTLYGLVRHNACVQGGDSGGANISAGAYALGVTSGASTTISGGLCLSKAGGQNVSWYQPVGEALAANGLRLLYQP